MQEHNDGPRDRSGTRGVALGIAAMAVVVTASNILVQYPINDWLTWGPSRTRSRFWSPI